MFCMPEVKYEDWSEQVNNAKDFSEVFREDPKAARKFFPRYVQERLDSERAVKSFTTVTKDYSFTFREDLCGEHSPDVYIQNRRFRIVGRSEKGTTQELAEYAAKVMSRKGIARFVFNILPGAIGHAGHKVDDVFHNLFLPTRTKLSDLIFDDD